MICLPLLTITAHKASKSRTNLEGHVAQERAARRDHLEIYYHLTGQLGLRQIGTSSMFEWVHAQLRAAGRLDHDYARGEFDKPNQIRYLVNRIAPQSAR